MAQLHQLQQEHMLEEQMKEQQKQQNRNDNILGPRMSGFQKDESSDPLVGLVGDLNND